MDVLLYEMRYPMLASASDNMPTAMLYNAETWTVKQDQMRKLRVVEMDVLRKICVVTTKDRSPNVT